MADLTRCGITAPDALWRDFKYHCDGVLVPARDYCSPQDMDLYMARQQSGCDDWRALGWLRKFLMDRVIEESRIAAAKQLADALKSAGDEWVHGARVMRQQAEIARR